MSSCDLHGDSPPAASPPASPPPDPRPDDAPAPAAPAAVPSSPSPHPEPAPVLRWADLAELDDEAAGRPVVRRDPPARPAMTRRESEQPPRRGGSEALSRSRRPAVAAPPTTPRKKATLGPRTARRRRAPAWGVAGRSDQGCARVSWRSSAAAANASSAGVPLRSPAASPACCPLLLRTSPFRPFIASFGSSAIRFSPSLAPRRSWPALPPAPAPAAVGVAASGETLAPNRSRSRSPLPAADWRSQRRRSPSPPRRREGARSPARGGRSRSPARPHPPATSSDTRRYQPPRGEPSFPPGANGAGRGKQGPKRKKKRGLGRGIGPAMPAAPPRNPAAAASTALLPDDQAADLLKCFNCGLAGHSQVTCTHPQCCFVCSDPDHPAALCPDRPVSEELMMYGHGIEGLGYFHIEVPDIPPTTNSLLAIVTVRDGVASPEMIEAELNHLYHCNWDWQVTLLAGGQFSMVFPDAVSHSYGTRSGDITLALNKLVVDISVPVRDPLAVAVLDTAWILIGGLPDIARSERVIRNMSRILGKVVVVDELSLRKEEEVRVKVKSLDSSKLRATIRVFFNDQGFDLRISPEPPNHVGRPRIPDDSLLGGGPAGGGMGDRRSDRGPRHGHNSGSEDDDEEYEDSPRHERPPASAARGGAGAGRSHCLAPPPPTDSSDASDASLQVLPTSSPRSPVGTPPGIPTVLLAGADPAPATQPPPTAPALPEEEGSGRDQDPPPSPPRAVPVLSDLGVIDPPPGSDLTPSPLALDVVTLASPSTLPPASTCSILGGTSAVVTTPVAAPPLPPRTAAYSRRGRSTSTPVTSSRRSARIEAARPEGSPALPIPERAELRAAARNLEPGTPSIPATPATCPFSALESAPLGQLAKVAADSAIVFRGEIAPPLVQIEAIRAREILDGRLAEARSRLLTSSETPATATPSAQPQAVAAPAEIRGRTRSRTAALRAQSASRVLGSSSPPMVS